MELFGVELDARSRKREKERLMWTKVNIYRLMYNIAPLTSDEIVLAQVSSTKAAGLSDAHCSSVRFSKHILRPSRMLLALLVLLLLLLRLVKLATLISSGWWFSWATMHNYYARYWQPVATAAAPAAQWSASTEN